MTTTSLKALRRRLRLSSAQLAAVVGRSQRTVLRWEAGGRIAASDTATLADLAAGRLDHRLPVERRGWRPGIAARESKK